MREVIVYSRQGCHLCELMLEQVGSLCRGKAEIVVRDVDTRVEWADAYGIEVPVLLLDGAEVCRYEFDRTAFVAALNGSATGQHGT